MQKLIFLTLLFAALLLGACTKGEQYGAGVDQNAPVVKVNDLFLKPELMGRKVTLEGSVFTQCQSSGCWFVLEDDTGQVYVDLSRSQLTLPARLGKKATASGIVGNTQGNLLLFAEGVVIK